jgi:hypothetical protein
MHAYITDSAERRDMPLYTAGISIFLSLGISELFEAFHVTVPAWIDVTSVAALYGLLYGLFDEFWWRWPIFQWLGVVKVPVLAGRWTGYVLSSYDNHGVPHPVNIRIEQTWTRMRISLVGEQSNSHSFLGAIFIDAAEGKVIDYEYQNEPSPGAVASMQIHHGTARLRILTPTKLEGYYYTGRGRGHYGSIQLRRQEAISQG